MLLRRILLPLVSVVALLGSCTTSYIVQGSSTISSLDGSKLYLKTVKDNELQDIDSCEILHGKFQFTGALDTVKMANLFMDEEGIMPMVLEKGEIVIRLDNAVQSVGGTPFNDKLYDFLEKHKQLENQMLELSHKESQMLLEGIDEYQISLYLNSEVSRITKEEDNLVTTFIVENFDNVLGPGVFMMLTNGYPYPILTPQIEHIMSKATSKFKSDPYVADYYKRATEYERQLQGLDNEVVPVVAGDTLSAGDKR